MAGASHGGKFLIAGTKCWILDPKAPTGQQIRVVSSQVPWGFYGSPSRANAFAGDAAQSYEEAKARGELQQIYLSNRYGLLARKRATGDAFYRGVFKETRD